MNKPEPPPSLLIREGSTEVRYLYKDGTIKTEEGIVVGKLIKSSPQLLCEACMSDPCKCKVKGIFKYIKELWNKKV